MNKEKKIEHYLITAPKPPAPGGLLNKLKEDATNSRIQSRPSILRRCLTPTGDSVSPIRAAALTTIATMVLIPLSYAGGKIIKTYIFTDRPEVKVIENEDGSVTRVGSISVSIESEDISDAEQVEAACQEIDELRKAGRFVRTLLREWEEKGMRFSLYKISYTLLDGKVITVNEIEAGSISK